MGGKGSGRLFKDANTRQIQQTLTESAVYAVKLVRDALRGTDVKGRKVRPLSGSKVKICELAINHAIGTPRQKIDLRHSGEVLTIRDLALLAFEEVKELPEPERQALQPGQDIVEGEHEPARADSSQPDNT
jgi:hypothetical protein